MFSWCNIVPVTCTDKTKRIPRDSTWWLPGLCSSSRENEAQEARFHNFLALAQEINKTSPSRPDYDFLALAPEVGKTNPRKLDLMNFQPWLKKSAKPVLGNSIWWLSGLGYRRRENQSKEARFDDFLVLAPEVIKTSPMRLDSVVFWPWIQKSTKQ